MTTISRLKAVANILGQCAKYAHDVNEPYDNLLEFIEDYENAETDDEEAIGNPNQKDKSRYKVMPGHSQVFDQNTEV